MSQTILSLFYDLSEATLQTLWMVTACRGLVTLLLGLPIGILLYASGKIICCHGRFF